MSAARAAQRLVRGGGGDVRVLERREHQARCDEAGHVRHVREQPRALWSAMSRKTEVSEIFLVSV